MTRIRCRCSFLTVNPWRKSYARMPSSDCPIHAGTPRWKRATGHFVESHCGDWWITPVYGGLTRPESYKLQIKTADGWRSVGSGSTQRECKEEAGRLDAMGAEVAHAPRR